MAISCASVINIMRNVTGRVDASDPLFTDTIMTQYLNDFIVQLSSQDIRIFKNMTWWEFDIFPNTANPMPVVLQDLKLTTIGPPAYVQLPLSTISTNVSNVPMVGVIDGVNQIFTLAANQFIIRETFVATGTNPAQIISDDANGNVVGSGSGVINYNTGQINIVFDVAPVIGSTVTASYNYSSPGTTPNYPNFSLELWWFQDPTDFYRHWPDRLTYRPQRPTAVLYYNNSLTFRGPPDKQYHIKIQAYHEEIAVNSDGNLNNDYLFRYLAYGASLDIFSDFGEMDKWREIFPVFQRYRALVYSRTYSQYQNQRPNPEF